MNNINVGDRSAFSFLAPYDSILSETMVYEVTNISTLKRLIDTGKDPLNNIYISNGMTLADYMSDLGASILIVELVVGTKSYYIPMDRITTVPSGSVIYSERMIGIKLGYIPSDEVLDSLLPDIDLLIKARLGITTTAVDKITSSDRRVGETAHTDRVSVREGLMTEDGNYMSMYLSLMSDHSSLIGKLKALETAELNSRL